MKHLLIILTIIICYSCLNPKNRCFKIDENLILHNQVETGYEISYVNYKDGKNFNLYVENILIDKDFIFVQNYYYPTVTPHYFFIKKNKHYYVEEVNKAEFIKISIFKGVNSSEENTGFLKSPEDYLAKGYTCNWSE